MVQATTRFQTIEQYIATDSSDLPEQPYELVNGAIVDMGSENNINVLISGFLFAALLQVFPHYRIHQGTEVEVNRPTVTTRLPNLLVLAEAGHAAMQRHRRSLITLAMSAPALVVEVVSPGEPGPPNYDRDHVVKRQEYADRGIPEYWLIDPSRSVVILYQLVDGAYQGQEFRGEAAIASPGITLSLTAQQLLTAGL